SRRRRRARRPRSSTGRRPAGSAAAAASAPHRASCRRPRPHRRTGAGGAWARGYPLYPRRPRPAFVAWRQNRPVDIERPSFEEQLSLQEERLARQIERVRAGSPYYGERLSAGRSGAELAEQPFVTKAELLAAQAEEPPLGPIAGV